jgi:splicing factor U2AF 35 kDa subunit
LVEAAMHFENFYEEIFREFSDYGEILDLVVADNIGEHMMGNVYVKFASEEQAETCFKTLNGKFYNMNQIVVEYSPVTDFREAKCRQYHEGSCERGGYCNFIHPKFMTKQFVKDLTDQMYKEHPKYLEAKKE